MAIHSQHRLIKLRECRRLLRQGERATTISRQLGLKDTDVATQRKLLIAAGFPVATEAEARSIAGKMRASAVKGFVDESLDLCTMFSARPSRKQVRYWTGGDE